MRLPLERTNPALHSAALRLAQLETQRSPHLKLSRRLQRLQVQQDALIAWYHKNREKYFMDWPCGPTTDNEDQMRNERTIWEFRQSSGLIGVFAKQWVHPRTTVHYPGIIMTNRAHAAFVKEVYCPTAIACRISGEKYKLVGFPCRVGPMINNRLPVNCKFDERAKADSNTDVKEGAVIMSGDLVSLSMTKAIPPNTELVCQYGNRFFDNEANLLRSCDMCARRLHKHSTMSLENRDAVQCSSDGCWFARHLECFASHDRVLAEEEDFQFLCLDHENPTEQTRYDDAVRMLRHNRKSRASNAAGEAAGSAASKYTPPVFDAAEHFRKLEKQQSNLELLADAEGWKTWSRVPPSAWVQQNFDIRPSGLVPGTLGVFAKVDINNGRFPGCVVVHEGQRVEKEYRIPYNGLVVNGNQNKKLYRSIHCPTTVGFTTKGYDLFGNPADLGPMINSVLPDDASGVNCRFSTTESSDPVRAVFVQISSDISKDHELFLDYGEKFWGKEQFKVCEKCQLDFDNETNLKGIPQCFDQRQSEGWQLWTCTAHEECPHVIHGGCGGGNHWVCHGHKKSKNAAAAALVEDDVNIAPTDDEEDREIIEIEDSDEEKKEQAPEEASMMELDQASTTSRARLALRSVAAKGRK